MAAASKQSHLTFGDCQIIQKGIENGSSKKAMADLLGKDKSTIGKEIRLHRELTYKSRLPLECAAYAHCKFNRIWRADCVDYVPFTCTRRELSYAKGRTSKEYDEYIAANPNARIMQMDTVNNDAAGGPFIQTFKFLRYACRH